MTKHFNDLSLQEKLRFHELVKHHGLAGYYKFCIEMDEEMQKRLDGACGKTNPWLAKIRKLQGNDE